MPKGDSKQGSDTLVGYGAMQGSSGKATPGVHVEALGEPSARSLMAYEVDENPVSDHILASTSGAIHEQPLLSDRYRLKRPLGAGGMSVVYLAEHVRIRKPVAIKILADKYVGDEARTLRFLREARATSEIQHPNVIEISDFGETHKGAPFFVMEYLDGDDLGQLLHRQGPVPWARVSRWLLQICAGLRAAHEAGIVHRDLKPDNCIRVVREDGRELIKVIDFGVAKLSGDQAVDGERLTQTGVVVGTPEYLSPEQARGEHSDHRGDIYALGIIATELLTGKLPFTASNYMDVLTAHGFEAAPSFAELAPAIEFPVGVEALVRKTLQKQAANRFQSVAELAMAIEELCAEGVVPAAVVDDATGAPKLDGPMVYAKARAAEGEREAVGEWLGPLALAVGMVLLLVGLGAGWWLYGRDPGPRESRAGRAKMGAPSKAGPPRGSAPSLAKAPAPRTSAVSVPTDSAEPVVESITVRIDSNVEASIVDALDGAVYGRTNDAVGFRLERDSEAVRLRLSAPGYVDFEFQIVPSGDRTFTQKLVPIERGRPRKGKSKAEESPEPAAPEPNPFSNSDVKDPFGP